MRTPGGQPDPTSRRAGWLVVGLLTAFWALVVVAGFANRGYSHASGHVSDLASYGAAWPWLGIAAISAFGLADLAGALAVRRVVPAAAGLLAVAGVAGLAIAAFRIHCGGSAVSCGAGASPTWSDTAHGGAVAVNALAFALAMLVSAGRTWALGRRRGAAAVAVGALGGLGFLLMSLDGPYAGIWQRAWLLTTTVLLLVATSDARPRRPR